MKRNHSAIMRIFFFGLHLMIDENRKPSDDTRFRTKIGLCFSLSLSLWRSAPERNSPFRYTLIVFLVRPGDSPCGGSCFVALAWFLCWAVPTNAPPTGPLEGGGTPVPRIAQDQDLC